MTKTEAYGYLTSVVRDPAVCAKGLHAIHVLVDADKAPSGMAAAWWVRSDHFKDMCEKLEEAEVVAAEKAKPVVQVRDLLRSLSVGEVYELASELHNRLGDQARFNALRDGLGK
jgi:hypothetical protein